MAQDDVSSWTAYKGPGEQAPEPSPTWGDYGRAVVGGAATGVAAPVGALGQAAGEYGQGNELGGEDSFLKLIGSGGKLLRQSAHEFDTEMRGGMTPEGRARLEAAITSDKFWQHPVSVLALKATNQAPQIVASLIPAGLATRAAAVAAASMSGGALTAGQGVDEFFEEVEKASDADLRQAKFYRDLREAGMSEDEARARYGNRLRGSTSAANFLMGSLMSAIGPEAMLAKGLTGGVAGSLASRVGQGVVGGAIGEAVEEGVQDALQQRQSTTEGRKQFISGEQIANAALEGAAIGGIFGGAAGVVSGERKKRAPKAEDYSVGAGSQPKAAGTGIAPKPNENIEVGDPQNKVTRSDRDGYQATEAAKATSKKRSKPYPTVREVAPDIELAAANNAGTPAESIEDKVTASIAQMQAINAQAQAALGQITPEVSPQPVPTPTAISPQPVPVQEQAPPAPLQPEPIVPAQAPVQGVPEVAAPPVQPTSALPTAPVSAPIAPAPAPVAPAPVQPAPELTDDLRDARARELAAKAIPTVAPTKAEVKNVKAQEKAQLAALAPPREIKETGTQKRGEEHTRARTLRERTARRLMNRFKPVEGETAQQTALRAAEIMGNAQKLFGEIPKRFTKQDKEMERFGRIPHSLRDQEKSAALTLVKEAQKLIRAFHAKKATAKSKMKALEEFRFQERSIRAGYVEQVRSDRVREADEKLKRTGELLEEVTPTKEGGAGGAVDIDSKLAPSPEEIVEAKQEEGAALGEARERPMPARVAAMTTEEKFATPKAPRAPVVVKERKKLAALMQKVAEKKQTAVSAPPAAKAAFVPAEVTRKAPRKPPKQGASLEVAGLPVTISHRKGEARNGVEEIPANYGEIKGVKGADGDNLDAWFGPKAWPGKANKVLQTAPVYVIDQLNVETREFDEHKVMLGFDRRDQALETYDKAFADGRGAERVGAVKEMSWDQFKVWLEQGDQTRPVSQAAGAKQEEFVDEMDVAKRGAFRVYGNTGPQDINVVDTMSARDAANKFPDVQGPLGRHSRLIRKRLLAKTGNLPVHLVTRADMKRLVPRKDGMITLGFYDYTRHQIVMIDEVFAHPFFGPKIFQHELVHAATDQGMNVDPSADYAIQRVMNEALAADPSLAETYGFSNTREFIAEAMSDAEFQTKLMAILLKPETVRGLNMVGWKKVSVWEVLVDTIRKMLGLSKDQYTALDAAIRLTDYSANIGLGSREMVTSKVAARLSAPVYESALNSITPRVEDARTNARDFRKRLADKLSTMIQLAHRARQGGEEFARIARDLVEFKAKMEHEKFTVLEKAGGGMELVKQMANFIRKHGPGAFRTTAELAFDASNMNVNLGPGADNSHLGKDATKGWQAKARLDALQARYDALPEDAKKLLQDAVSYFRAQQNAISKGIIRNVLHATLGSVDEALVDRIHTDGLDDADRALFETDSPIRKIAEARELKQIKGWYFPFRRYGNWVVSGREKLDVPANGIKIGDEEIQFTSASDTKARDQAEAFVAGHKLTHIGTRRHYVDATDHTKEVEKEDPNAVYAYRVRMQTQYTAFHADRASAERETEALRADGLTMDTVQERRDDEHSRGALMSYHMRTALSALEKQKRFQSKSDGTKKAIRQAMYEASIRMMGSTRLQSSFLQRRNVAGMSTDLARVSADYVRSSAAYLARLNRQPDVDRAFDKLDQYIKDHKNDKENTRRSELRNELRRRLEADLDDGPQTGFSRFVLRALQISRLDKLAGISYHLINAQEPWLVSLPVIGGRHGFGAATYRLGEAYRLIGAATGALRGLTDTKRAFSEDLGFTDYVKMFSEELRKSPALGPEKANRLVALLEYLRERGLFSDEAIFEVSRFADPAGNILARGIDRADLMANQVGSAIEKINRSVTAIAAYQLEFAKTGSHETAMAYAYETTHDTMGDYASWNAAPIFQHPVGKLALQFKKYGQKTYFLLGKTVAKAARGDKEAIKQFGGLMLSHMLVAGALGLPLEPFRVAMMAAGVFGLGIGWGDVEEWTRRRAREMLGAKGGELFSRGLTRMIGIDTSGRQGLDQLMFGKSSSIDATTKTDKVKALFFDTFAGAPAGYLIDQISAAQALQKGEKAKAAELSMPIKAYADVSKAVRGYSEGIKSATGRERIKPLSVWEATSQAAGFTPARVAESYELERNFYGKRDRLKAARTDMISGWVNASAADKRQALATINKWNVGRPKAEQITMADLERSVNARKKEDTTMKHGIRANKREQHLLADSPYNVGR